MRNAGIRAVLSRVAQSESCNSAYTQTEMANLLRGKCLLPQPLSTLLLKQGFPVNLELAGLAKLTIHSRDPPVSTSTTLELQACTTTPGFLM